MGSALYNYDLESPMLCQAAGHLHVGKLFDLLFSCSTRG